MSGRLSLAGVDPKAASESETHLSLGAVYTALLTLEIEIGKRLPIGILPRRLSALELLNLQPRLVLLGDPGSGKSTFVNFVALCLSGEALRHSELNLKLLTAPLLAEDEGSQKELLQAQPWEHDALLPVRVVLRDFAACGLPTPGDRATAKHLWNFIAGELEAASLKAYTPHLQEELLKQGGLLLLDGLDEVPESEQRRVQIKQAVEDFAATYGKCRILVTSRTYAYQKQDWRLASFAEAVLAPFGAGQIRRFVERWYDHVGILRRLSPTDSQGRAKLLQYAIFSSNRLRGLAERPLLLTLMASLHAWRGGSLPEKREELYADTVDLLLDWWERPKIVHTAAGHATVQQPSLAEWLKVGKDRVLGLLAELAYKVHAAQPQMETAATADISEGDLVTGLMRLSRNPDVNPSLLVSYLSERAGLLLPHGVGVYTFPHRTFQEYLAACYLTDHDYPDKVADLVREDFNRWREVALLAGAKAARGTASAIWSLVEALCYREPGEPGCTLADAWGAHLSGLALAETANLAEPGERNQRRVARVQTWLVHVLRENALPARERVQAGITLSQLGDPRQAVLTLENMELCYIPPGPFVMGDRADESKQHKNKTLDYGYWLGRYPVTVAQWRMFVFASGHEPIQTNSVRGIANHPVVWVTWREALKFCAWLTVRFKKCLPLGYSITLPSEAEWEKAARGGDLLPREPLVQELIAGLQIPLMGSGNSRVPNPTPVREYPWGDVFDVDKVNSRELEVGTTSTVGCFSRGVSPYGILEMSGNVWELMRDLIEDDPQNPQGERTIGRGGSFSNSALEIHSAHRAHGGLDDQYSDLGIRLAVSKHSEAQA